ncbi:MAG: NAD-binding protein, partial [Thiovulaceae bacterium]|nr:NAD-binding protein [Sulfurimonadaceae bacterium]
MKMYDVVVFGYEEFAKEIVQQVSEAYRSVVVYTLKEASVEEAVKEGIEAKQFTLDDDWDDFAHFNMKKTLFICALEDDASNVYLTIGLRDGLKNARLVALAST